MRVHTCITIRNGNLSSLKLEAANALQYEVSLLSFCMLILFMGIQRLAYRAFE